MTQPPAGPDPGTGEAAAENPGNGAGAGAPVSNLTSGTWVVPRSVEIVGGPLGTWMADIVGDTGAGKTIEMGGGRVGVERPVVAEPSGAAEPMAAWQVRDARDPTGRIASPPVQVED